jgi:hypothetical protein
MICSTLLLALSISSIHLTHHYEPVYNEVNPGITLECNNIAVGVYRNSYSDLSSHIEYVNRFTVSSFTFGTSTGLVTGYSPKPIPFIRPFVEYNHIRLGFIPHISNLRSEATITIEYTHKIDF